MKTSFHFTRPTSPIKNANKTITDFLMSTLTTRPHIAGMLLAIVQRIIVSTCFFARGVHNFHAESSRIIRKNTGSFVFASTAKQSRVLQHVARLLRRLRLLAKTRAWSLLYVPPLSISSTPTEVSLTAGRQHCCSLR